MLPPRHASNVPGALPQLPHLPEPPLGRLNLVHHADGRTVAVFDPRTGAAEARYELAEPEAMRDQRVRGRYAPLRSGVLAVYRDGADRIVVQRSRRRVVLADGAEVAVRSLGPLVSARLGRERLLMADGPGRPGAALLRAIAAGAGEWV